MKLFATLAAMAAVAQCASAWTIASSNATQPEEVLGQHQEFVKVWTVSGVAPVDAIRLAAAGPVFVDYDASLNGADATPAPTEESTPSPTATKAGNGADAAASMGGVVSLAAADEEKLLAKVMISGNCTKLLDEIEVVELHGELKVHFKNTNFRGYGYILTQVYVAEKESLAKVKSTASSSVYISEAVLVSSNSSAEVELATWSNADVFVTAPSTDFSLKSLDLKISGSGTIQFSAASLSVGDSLTSKVSGDGTVAVVATTVDVKNTLSSQVSGQAALFLQADTVTAFKLESRISGDGDVTISRDGSCESQKISVSGMGKVATGSIACVDTKLKVSGYASVLVQTSNTLFVPHEIEGKVQYVGAAPKLITDGLPRRPTHPPRSKRKHHGWFWWSDDDDDSEDDYDSEDHDPRFLPQSVTAAPENAFKTYELRDAPPREPTFLILSMNRNSWDDEPNEHTVIAIFGWDIDVGGGSIVTGSQSLVARVHEQHGPLGAAAFGGLVVVAVAAAGVAVHKRAVQRRRREYQPLLEVVAH